MAKTSAKNQPAEIGTDELLLQILGSLRKAVNTLDGCIDTITVNIGKAKEAGKYNDKDASHLAWLSARMTGLLGEVRKYEAGENKAIKNMKPAERDRLLKSWFREQPSKTIRVYIKFLEELQSLESAL